MLNYKCSVNEMFAKQRFAKINYQIWLYKHISRIWFTYVAGV